MLCIYSTFIIQLLLFAVCAYPSTDWPSVCVVLYRSIYNNVSLVPCSPSTELNCFCSSQCCFGKNLLDPWSHVLISCRHPACECFLPLGRNIISICFFFSFSFALTSCSPAGPWYGPQTCYSWEAMTPNVSLFWIFWIDVESTSHVTFDLPSDQIHHTARGHSGFISQAMNHKNLSCSSSTGRNRRHLVTCRARVLDDNPQKGVNPDQRQYNLGFTVDCAAQKTFHPNWNLRPEQKHILNERCSLFFFIFFQQYS